MTTRKKVVKEESPSFGPPDCDELVLSYTYPNYNVLQIWLPMLRSVNRKYGVNTHARFGRGVYINKEYREEEQNAIEHVQFLVAHAKWQIAPDDRYLVLYRFSFKQPTAKRQRTGDIHNPLKPFSDVLVAGGALYDDDNTRMEIIEKRNTTQKIYWAQITIYRFTSGQFPDLMVRALITDSLTTLFPERKIAS